MRSLGPPGQEKMMTLTGAMRIGGEEVRGDCGEVRSIAAATGQAIDPPFFAGGAREVDLACGLADAAFDSFRNTDPELRAGFLEGIAQAILNLGDTLVERVMVESGLPRARIEGERG